jgi:pimeloyl-ACP methyl ester carboxylesterase
LPFIDSDGVRLHYEEAGAGSPVLFAHEFGSDLTGWEPQIRFFSRYFRCIAFNARGYPPSDVPADPAAYSQTIAGDDVARLLSALGVETAHVVGLSMGSVTALDFGLRHGAGARSITLCGCGYGSVATDRQAWLEGTARMADGLQSDFERTMESYAEGPTRLPFKRKDPRGWQDFLDGLKRLSPVGTALSLRGIQAVRPALYDLEDAIRRLAMPALIVVGDEDEPALEPSLFLKRTVPDAALWVFPRTGHAVNTEEPDLFNRALFDFLVAVERKR